MTDETFYFPMNAGKIDEGTPNETYDRLWDAVDFARYYHLFIGNGVYPNPSTNLQIRSLYNNMTVTVNAGSAMLKGYAYLQFHDIDISVDSSSLNLSRIDDIVIRLDANIERLIALVYRKGAPSTSPVVSTLIRNDDYFELRVGEIFVGPGATNITNANIKDTRLDGNVCGIVSQMINEVDTTTLFEQYEAWFAEKKEMADRDLIVFIANAQEKTNFVREQFELLFGALETKSFTLINNNFDDWSVKRGCNYKTKFLSSGDIETAITVVTLDFILARRATQFLPNGNILKTITFYPWETTEGQNTIQTTQFSISEETIFEPDGSITKRVR